MTPMLTSSVMVDTEERGHTRVCLTHIYLLTRHFRALAIGWPNLSGRADVSVGTSSTRNQMVEIKAKDTNPRTTYSVENTSDVETKSVKIQEK